MSDPVLLIIQDPERGYIPGKVILRVKCLLDDIGIVGYVIIDTEGGDIEQSRIGRLNDWCY